MYYTCIYICIVYIYVGMGKLEEVRPPQPHTNIAAFIPFRFRVLIFVFPFFGERRKRDRNGERGTGRRSKKIAVTKCFKAKLEGVVGMLAL